MRIEVLAPVGDDNKIAEIGAEIIKAGKALGLELDYQGFLMAWVGTGVRVFVARDDSNMIVGILLLAIGERWLHKDYSASVLAVYGQYEDELLDYGKNVAKAIGATKMYYELPGAAISTEGYIDRTMRELRLQ